MRKIKIFCLILMLCAFGVKIKAQCATQPFDLANNYVATFHAAAAKSSNGLWYAWGQQFNQNGYTPTTTSKVNLVDENTYPTLPAGTVAKFVSGGSDGDGNNQLIALIKSATDPAKVNRIYSLIDLNFNSGSNICFTYNSLTPQYINLPAGVTSADVTSFYAGYGMIAIVANGRGYVYNNTLSNNVFGDGVTTGTKQWGSSVKSSASDNPEITTFVSIRGASSSPEKKGVLIGLTSDGEVYTWGDNTFIGGATASNNYTLANKVTLPTPSTTGAKVKLVGANYETKASLYAMFDNGDFWSIGRGDSGRLGDFGTAEQTSWVRVKKTNTGVPANDYANVRYFSTNEHDGKKQDDSNTNGDKANQASVQMILSDNSAYGFGRDGGYILGVGVPSSTALFSDPKIMKGGDPANSIPAVNYDGTSAGTSIITVEMGGHISFVYKKSAEFCIAGHGIDGSLLGTNATGFKEYFSQCTTSGTLAPCSTTPTIIANNDAFSIGIGNTSANSVLADNGNGADVVNGADATSSNVTLSTSGTWTGFTLNTTVGSPDFGKVTVGSSVAAGTYNLTYQICEKPVPTSGANCTTAIVTVKVGLDSDGDGVLNDDDIDDDNDGILDNTECGSTNRISNSSFITSPASSNTSTVTGWTLAGQTVTLNSTGIVFNATGDASGARTTTITQSLTGVVGSLSGSIIKLNNLSWVNAGTSAASIGKLDVSYAGVIYATISTGAAAGATGTYAASNNAAITITPSVANLTDGTKYTVNITLPSGIPASGALVLKFTSGTNTTAAATDDIILESISLDSCKDTDGDGIPDFLDLDSDNDGCPDAIEGLASIKENQLVNSSMLGGNSGASSGTYNLPVKLNLCASKSCVNAQGLPQLGTVSVPDPTDYNNTSGQGVGTSITVNSYTAGTVSTAQTIPSGVAPNQLTASTTGWSDTTAKYVWQSSTDNFATNVTDLTASASVPASGTAPAAYSPGILTSNTWYRILVTSAGGCSTASNVVKITVYPNRYLFTSVGSLGNTCDNGFSFKAAVSVQNNVPANDTTNLLKVTLDLPTTPTNYIDTTKPITPKVILNGTTDVTSNFTTSVNTTTGKVTFVLNATHPAYSVFDSLEFGYTATAVTSVTAGNGPNIYATIHEGAYQTGSTYSQLVINLESCACYNAPTNLTSTVESKHGITLLKRAGTDNGGWPMNRNSAHTVLESNTKGFVITRMTSDPAQTAAANHISKIATPQEGMMVYDTFEKCLKIYSDNAWSCFKTATCP